MKFDEGIASPFYDLSPSMRREWIEISGMRMSTGNESSPSMRREWIEMPYWSSFRSLKRVSLHAEGVD